METMNTKSLNGADEVADTDSDNNKLKDFPPSSDATNNLKKALELNGEKRDNRSISALIANNDGPDNTNDDHSAHVLNGNYEIEEQQRQQLLILDPLSEKSSSPRSKNGPMIESVSDGLTKIAIEENNGVRDNNDDEDEIPEQNAPVSEAGATEDEQQRISVVRLSQNGDFAHSHQQPFECAAAANAAAAAAGDESVVERPSCSSPCCVSRVAEADSLQHQPWSSAASLSTTLVSDGISYVRYENESQMPDIMRLITKDLSEPYSIYTYRYFIHNWPKLCFLAMDEDDKCVGAIVCKVGCSVSVSSSRDINADGYSRTYACSF